MSAEEITLFMKELVYGQYLAVAAVTTIVFDSLITLDMEVKYFWKKPISSISILYFLNRYSGILGAIAFLYYDALHVTTPLCRFSLWGTDIPQAFTIVIIDYILAVRVLAFWGYPKGLSIALKILIAMEAVVKFGLVLKGETSRIHSFGAESISDTLSVCTETGDIEENLWYLALTDWLFAMFVGLVLMTLALYKAVIYWKESSGFKGFTLIRVAIRDQGIYYLLVIACCVLNTTGPFIISQKPILDVILVGLGNPTFLSVLGSRLLFNLKEAGEYGVNIGTNYRSNTLSQLQFAGEHPPESEPYT